jgi:hypothetical protein
MTFTQDKAIVRLQGVVEQGNQDFDTGKAPAVMIPAVRFG